MNIESFRSFCLSKKGVTEEFPFDETTLVFKVMGKIFALTDLEQFDSINIKCDPEIGAQWRERYASVLPGHHMNKKHWITVKMDGSIPDRLLKQWIENSYHLVIASLTKSLKSDLDRL